MSYNLFNSKVKVTSFFIFISMGFFQLLIYANLYYLGDLRDRIIFFLGNYVLLFIGYLLAIYFFKRSLSEFSPLKFFTVLFIFSISFRITMIFSMGYLSTDILRYFWDGMLSINGVDPYKYVPSSYELEKFRTMSYYESYDHKDEFTIYPPLAQFFFLGSHLIFGDNPIGLKSLLSIFDTSNGILIFLIIRKMKGDNFQSNLGALIYLWNPLVIIEFAHSGHIDALAIFLLLLCIYSLSRTLRISSSTSLVASIFTKWIPILFLPIYMKYMWRQKKGFIKALLSIIVASLVIILPFYFSSGFNFILTTFNFIRNWRFESALSRFLILILPFEGILESFISKFVSYSIFIISIIVLTYKSRFSNITEIINTFLLLIALFYLIAPSTYPWYVPWILTMAILKRSGFITSSSIFLSGLAVVNYLQEFSTLSELQFWFAYIVWFIPVFAILAYYLYQSKGYQSLLKRFNSGPINANT